MSDAGTGSMFSIEDRIWDSQRSLCPTAQRRNVALTDTREVDIANPAFVTTEIDNATEPDGVVALLIIEASLDQ